MGLFLRVGSVLINDQKIRDHLLSQRKEKEKKRKDNDIQPILYVDFNDGFMDPLIKETLKGLLSAVSKPITLIKPWYGKVI
jgi:hypothetical protein